MKKIKYLFLTIKDFIDFYWFLFLHRGKISELKSNSKKPIWLFADRGVDAGDNGFTLFEYVVKNHPEIDAYFVISEDAKNSVDYKKVESIGNILHAGSVKHKLYFLVSDVLASSHVTGGIEPWRARVLNKFSNNYQEVKKIFLQHGVIKDDLSDKLGKQKNDFRIFICGAKPEYDYVLNNFGFELGVVQYTGLARYDNLHDIQTKNQVLLMPTWRKYIEQLLSENNGVIDENSFKETKYYNSYNNLLNNEWLQDLLLKNNMELIFYPHNNVQKLSYCFTTPSKNIKIANKENHDVQTLLKESKLLITDYSSVFFDFAYMEKPMMFYQFDEEEFFDKHYKKGYFDYRESGFGDVITAENELIKNIEKVIENNFEMEEKYKERIKGFFPLHDQKNCERIVKVIKDLK